MTVQQRELRLISFKGRKTDILYNFKTHKFEVKDWHKILEQPHNYNFMTLCALAKNWQTCATGDACRLLPRSTKTGGPDDGVLWHLGCEFHVCIVNEDFEKAKFILDAIEVRAGRLLYELKSKS